jgi:ribosome maturation protein SDO1
MVSVDKAVIARLSRNHVSFEILVDPDKSLEMRRGAKLSIQDVLAVQEIFKDAHKGERASAQDLEDCFKTKDIFAVAESIVMHGEIQLTTEQKHRMTEEKRKQVADIISKQGIDPKTKLPHPPQRIMNAMDQAHVSIDPFKPARDQIESVLTKICEVIPIRMEKLEIAVKIPIKFAGRASSIVRQIAPVLKEEWKPDCYIVLMEIQAGMQGDVYNRLNELTSGQVEVKIIKEKQI